MGYFKNGQYVKSEKFSAKAAFDRAQTQRAVNDCLLSIQEGSMTARQAMRHLLSEFTLLKREKRRAEKEHMLIPLIPYYVAEVLGNPKPKPQKEILYSEDA